VHGSKNQPQIAGADSRSRSKFRIPPEQQILARTVEGRDKTGLSQSWWTILNNILHVSLATRRRHFDRALRAIVEILEVISLLSIVSRLRQLRLSFLDNRLSFREHSFELTYF